MTSSNLQLTSAIKDKNNAAEYLDSPPVLTSPGRAGVSVPLLTRSGRTAERTSLTLVPPKHVSPPPTMEPIPSRAHRKDIDGLRAIAVLSVMGFHCGVRWLRGGFIGVDIFFVISGYLICTIIYRELEADTFSIARFYERRCKRILPALSLVLLGCLALATLVLSPVEVRRLGTTAIATSLSASNLQFYRLSGYFDTSSGLKPLLMTWSLAVEEQFYLAFPLFMFLLRKKSKRTLLAVLATVFTLSLLCSVITEFDYPSFNFFSPFTRAWELGAGTLLAIWQTGRQVRTISWKSDAVGWIGLLLILGPVFWYGANTHFPGYEAIPPVLGAVLLLASAQGTVNRLLGNAPLVGVGLISYSLYLWHWPLLSFARIISANPLHPRTVIILTAIAFAGATASYFLVEKPFRAKTSAPTSKVLLAYSCLIAALVGASSVFYISRGLPSRTPALAEIEAAANIDRGHPCLVDDFQNLDSVCLPPAEPGRPTLALLGDSHAEAISNVMRTELEKNNWRLVVLAHETCPSTKDVTRWMAAKETDSCRKFNRDALRYVLNRPDIQVVALLAGWGDRIYVPDDFQGSTVAQNTAQNAANMRFGVNREISALERAGKRVILIDDFPEFSFDPVESIRYRQMPLRRAINRLLLSDEPQQWQDNSQDAALELIPSKRLASLEFKQLAASDPSMSLVSAKDAFCRGGQCYFADQTDLYYYDGDHLSDSGAMKMMPSFFDLIQRMRRAATHNLSNRNP